MSHPVGRSPRDGVLGRKWIAPIGRAGLAFLIPSIAIAIATGTQRGGRLTGRVGTRAALLVGFVIGVIGTAGLAFGFDSDAGHGLLIPGLVVSGVDRASSGPPCGSPPPPVPRAHEQGIASTTLNLGNAIGLAEFTALADIGTEGKTGDAPRAATPDGEFLVMLPIAAGMVAGLLVTLTPAPPYRRRTRTHIHSRRTGGREGPRDSLITERRATPPRQPPVPGSPRHCPGLLPGYPRRPDSLQQRRGFPVPPIPVGPRKSGPALIGPAPGDHHGWLWHEHVLTQPGADTPLPCAGNLRASAAGAFAVGHHVACRGWVLMSSAHRLPRCDPPRHGRGRSHAEAGQTGQEYPLSSDDRPRLGCRVALASLRWPRRSGPRRDVGWARSGRSPACRVEPA